MRIIPLLAWFGVAGMGLFCALRAPAGDFAVENRIYLGHDDQPQSESLTVLVGERAYDFLAEPPESTIIDLPGKRIRLLNTAKRSQTEIDFGTLVMLTERLRQRLAEHTDRDFQFYAHPKFHIIHDAGAGKFEFEAQRLTYRVETFRAEPGPSGMYWSVSDWLCRLNLLLRPGSPTPLARLEVNATLAPAGVLPRRVELTPAPRNLIDWLPQRRTLVRSEHLWHTPPTDDMLRRVSEADRAVSEFRPLPLADYLGKRGDE